MLDQLFNHSRAGVVRRQVQCGVAQLVVVAPGIGPVLQQRRHHILMPVFGGHVQRRPARRGEDVDLCRSLGTRQTGRTSQSGQVSSTGLCSGKAVAR
jgi:hypothetical protein